jgi:hypothetical protein
VAKHYAGIDNLTVQQARPSDLEFPAARVIVAKQNFERLGVDCRSCVLDATDLISDPTPCDSRASSSPLVSARIQVRDKRVILAKVGS